MTFFSQYYRYYYVTECIDFLTRIPVLTTVLVFVMNFTAMLFVPEVMSMVGGEALFPFAKRPTVAVDVSTLLYQKDKLNWLPWLNI